MTCPKAPPAARHRDDGVKFRSGLAALQAFQPRLVLSWARVRPERALQAALEPCGPMQRCRRCAYRSRSPRRPRRPWRSVEHHALAVGCGHLQLDADALTAALPCRDGILVEVASVDLGQPGSAGFIGGPREGDPRRSLGRPESGPELSQAAANPAGRGGGLPLGVEGEAARWRQFAHSVGTRRVHGRCRLRPNGSRRRRARRRWRC